MLIVSVILVIRHELYEKNIASSIVLEMSDDKINGSITFYSVLIKS